MKRNPIVPYILIMVLGLGLVFFLSIKGIGDSKELAADNDGDQAETEVFEPEAYAQKSCIGCHGGDLTGASAPSLHGTGLSAAEIKEILINGKGTMPPGLVKAENVDEMAEWVANLE